MEDRQVEGQVLRYKKGEMKEKKGKERKYWDFMLEFIHANKNDVR